ncbi:hypothetical protein AB0K25_19830 [Micromonospora sp. NPDC049257]|uniref:hypothetical protein n=1 Tax=Micromonospora sp. NPDC049257 TaxID=3155771 RepID=UPI00341A616F
MLTSDGIRYSRRRHRELPGRQGPGRSRPAPGPPLDSWHRFTTLALAALAVLAICAADTDDDSTDTRLIKLTVNETRWLINTLVLRPIRDLTHRLRWSDWRRRHQARVRQAHYTRRLNLELQP